MKRSLNAAFALAAIAVVPQAMAQVTFFDREDFQGRAYTADRPTDNFAISGMTERPRSVIVDNGRWEVCEYPRFGGRCVVLRPGRYPSLAAMGLDHRMASIRDVAREARVEDYRYAPAPMVQPDNARYAPRYGERMYTVPVTSVRAVVAQAGQRCWMEPGQVQDRRANVGGAIAGAVLGGIIGHQLGGGGGKDLATAGGAIGGAALGANIGRSGQAAGPDVQRCENVSYDGRPDYWDVTYSFQGTEHRVQMSAPPGPTISVNERGEPRA